MARFPLFWRALFRIRSVDKGLKITLESRNRVSVWIFTLYVFIRMLLRGEIHIKGRFGR